MTDSCDPRDCSLPGSSALGFFRWEYWSGLSFPLPGDLPEQGMEPTPPVSLALQVDSLPTEPFGSYGNSMLTFFFSFLKNQHTVFHSGYTILYSSNSKGSSSPLTSSCFFFFNTQPSGCKAIKNHCTLSSFITKQCANQTSILCPWLLLSFSLSSPPCGCCMHEIVTEETRPCCLFFFPIFYYENVQIQQSWRHR